MPLPFGDYAKRDWFFIAVCGACGGKAILGQADILAWAGTGKVHRGMRLSEPETAAVKRWDRVFGS